MREQARYSTDEDADAAEAVLRLSVVRLKARMREARDEREQYEAQERARTRPEVVRRWFR